MAAIVAVAAGQVALTYDDGPSPSVTPVVLDALAEFSAHGTFFVNGESTSAPFARSMLRRIADEGHAIGNHGWSHSRGRSPQLLRMKLWLEDALGTEIDLVRAPFGDWHVASPEMELLERAIPVHWSLDSLDWVGASESLLVARSAALSGQVVLLHDGVVREARNAERGHVPAVTRLMLGRILGEGLRTFRW